MVQKPGAVSADVTVDSRGADAVARAQPVEVVVLGEFAVEHRGADRAPGLPPEGLDTPLSVSGSASRRATRPPVRHDPRATCWTAQMPGTCCCVADLFPIARGVDAKTGRLVHDGTADLPVIFLAAVERVGFHPGIGAGQRDLDAVPISRVEHGEIPEMGVVPCSGGRRTDPKLVFRTASVVENRRHHVVSVPYEVSNLKPPQVGES